MSLIALAFAATLTVSHTPVDCLLKGRFARMTAEVAPVAEVAEARVYFKRAGEAEPFAVSMALTRGMFVARLPKARDTGTLLYFIEVVGQDGTIRRTTEMQATVVDRVTACAEGAVIADDADGEDVVVLSRGDKKPKGFNGIAEVSALERVSASAPARVEPPPAAPAPPRPTPTPRPTPASASRPVARPTPRAEAPPEVAPARVAPVVAVDTSQGDDYRVGPGDILRIMVYGHEDLTQTVTVQTDGTFTFPLVGRVVAGGVTIRDLQRSLATALGKGFVRNPQVTVVVQEYHSQSVFVVGEVARPGTYPLQGPTTVVEVLAKAGPTANAGHEVIIVRPRNAVDGPVLPTEVDEAGATAEVIRVNVREIRMGKLDQNVVLRPRDTVFVSEAAKVFVSGEVKAGGAFTYNPGMTVRQAISMAGGFTPEASTGRIRVVRPVDGEMREVKIKLDEPVEPGDTVVVKAKLF